MRAPLTSPQSLTSDYQQFTNENGDTLRKKQNLFLLESLRVIHKLQLNYQSNSSIKVIQEWLINNKGIPKPNRQFKYCDFSDLHIGLCPSFIVFHHPKYICIKYSFIYMIPKYIYLHKYIFIYDLQEAQTFIWNKSIIFLATIFTNILSISIFASYNTKKSFLPINIFLATIFLQHKNIFETNLLYFLQQSSQNIFLPNLFWKCNSNIRQP